MSDLRQGDISHSSLHRTGVGHFFLALVTLHYLWELDFYCLVSHLKVCNAWKIYRVSINSDTDWAAICGQTAGVRKKSVFSFFFGHKKLYKNMLLYSIYRQPFSHSSLETNTHKILWHVFDQCKSERWITFIFSNSTFKVQHFI